MSHIPANITPLILFDTEATCWGKEDGSPSWWSEDWQEPELIQISAVTVDAATMTPIGPAFNVYIKPEINPEISEYCTNLTGIDNALLDEKGVSFEEAARLFREYCGGHTPYSYGDDTKWLNYNREELHGLADTMPEFKGGDISPVFHEIDPVTKSVNSGALAKHFNVEMDVVEHNALDDCRSIAAALEALQSHEAVRKFVKKLEL